MDRPSPEERQADAELEKLRGQFRRGVDVGPQITVVMARKLQAKLLSEMDQGKVTARTAAAALKSIEDARKAAEAAVDLRAVMRKELADELLAVADRVLRPVEYDILVKELERGLK